MYNSNQTYVRIGDDHIDKGEKNEALKKLIDEMEEGQLDKLLYLIVKSDILDKNEKDS